MKWIALCWACSGLASSPTMAAGTQVPEVPPLVQHVAATTITRETLEGPIRFLASDLLEGRGPATRGDQLARLYLATELEGLGYQPAGPGGKWEQPFDIVASDTHFPRTWSFQGKYGSVDLAWRSDYTALSGVQVPAVSIEGAELVFVGYGIQAPEYRWDDFKGVNLEGKILLMLNNDPDWDPGLFAGKRRLYYGRWDYKYESAARQGAAGAIIIHTTPSAGYPWQVLQSSANGQWTELPAAGEPLTRIKAWATEEGTRRLLAASGFDLDKLTAAARSRSFKPVSLGIHTSISFTSELTHTQTANVAGILRGSDPSVSDEVVVFTAHHDHLGLGEPDATGDRVYHGAEDNASGCAQVLAAARAFASLTQRPRRSVLILFVAAEEKGLLGSLYYSLHPTVPTDKIAADINIDGGNLFGATRDVTLVSAGKSSLDQFVEAVARSQGRVVKPDQYPELGDFYRSDQLSFARVGVPSVYLDYGTDFVGRPPQWGREQIDRWRLTNYHQPGDRLSSSWNFDGMVADARLDMLTGWLIAQAPAMPTWNPGDEFEAVRGKALGTRLRRVRRQDPELRAQHPGQELHGPSFSSASADY